MQGTVLLFATSKQKIVWEQEAGDSWSSHRDEVSAKEMAVRGVSDRKEGELTGLQVGEENWS